MQQDSAHSTEVEPIVVREQIVAVYLLAWVAAFCDAIGFLILQQFGASFMTGNTLFLGVSLGQLNWSGVINRGLPILSFVTGLLFGIMLLLQVKHRGIRFSFTIVFILEILCLVMFLIIGNMALQHGVIISSQGFVYYLCIILLSSGLGLQTATLLKIKGQAVRTTFMTGVISNWSQALVQYLSWFHEQLIKQQFRNALRETKHQITFHHLIVLSGTWGCYVLGAICGAILEQRFFLNSLFFPLCALIVLIIIDIIRPFEMPS